MEVVQGTVRGGWKGYRWPACVQQPDRYSSCWHGWRYREGLFEDVAAEARVHHGNEARIKKRRIWRERVAVCRVEVWGRGGVG